MFFCHFSFFSILWDTVSLLSHMVEDGVFEEWWNDIKALCKCMVFSVGVVMASYKNFVISSMMTKLVPNVSIQCTVTQIYW